MIGAGGVGKKTADPPPSLHGVPGTGPSGQGVRKIGKACGWKHPKTPLVKHLRKDKATDVVLEFLDTRVGCSATLRRLPKEKEGRGEENEEDGPGPP